MKQLYISAIVCVLLLFVNCRKGLPPQPRFIAVHKETVTLTGEIGSKDTIYIASNDHWQVSLDSDADWLTVEPTSGTGDGMIVISTITKNTSTSRKTTNVEVRSVNSTNSRLVTVVQVQFNQVILNAVFGGEGFDTFNDFTATTDGGYMAVGLSTSTQGDGTGGKGAQDVWVVKFDSDGKKQWHKKFGGTGDESANSIIRTSANSYMILGATKSNNGDVSGNHGEEDAWLIGIDGEGNLQWQKSIGGSNIDALFNLKPAEDGNFLMAGFTYSSDGDVSSNHGDADAWIVKVNNQGNIVWEETYGGTKQDLAYDATAVSDGGYIFCGRLVSMDGDASDRTTESFAAWFVKLNGAGVVAGKVYLGSSEYDYGTVALEAANGDYLFAGETNTPGVFDNFHSGRDAFLLRLDAAGNIRWKKAYGGSVRDEPADLVETDDGNFVFAGLTISEDGDIPQNYGGEDAWIMKLDGDGDIINNVTLGGVLNDNVMRVQQLNNNNFALAGLTGSFEDEYPDLNDSTHGWFQILGLN